MRFFGLKSCDTCRRALRLLRDAGIDPDVIDLRADGVRAGRSGGDALSRRSATA